MTDDEMIALIQATMEAQYEADTYSADEPTRAKPHPPASPEEINAFEAHLHSRQLTLPPSYAQFLRLHNGIDDYVRGLSIRSIQQVEHLRERDVGWRNISPIYQFIFASGEETSSIAGFIPGSEDERGEMKVVVLSEQGEPNEYRDFEGFLKDQLHFYQDVLQAERAEREGLEDD